MLATGSTVALAAGGLFFSAAPASADLDSPECLAAQAAFIAALDGAGVDAGLLAELDIALDNVVTAQTALDALVNGSNGEQAQAQAALTAAELVLEGLAVDLGLVQGDLEAALALVAAADLEIGTAQGDLEAVVNAQAILVADAQADINAALRAQADAAQLLADANLAVAAALLTPDDLTDDAAAAQLVANANLAITTANGLFTTATLDFNTAVETQTRLVGEAEAAVTVAVDARDALILELDIAGLRAAVDQLELDVAAQLGVVAELNAALIAAGDLDAIAAAAANLEAALAVVAGLQVQLDGEALDLVALEALFDASISACGVVGTVGGPGVVEVVVDIDIIVDNNNGGVVGGGTGGVVGGGTGTGTGGSVVVEGGTGGTTVTNRGGTTGVGGAGNTGANRGVNIQTAAETEETGSAAGLGLLGLMTAGLGVAAATVGLRRKAQRTN
ncbi:hypothetical protein [Arthrobacter ruber]|uniref:hypothetical protein n=1 Tax=Arthrobacter ruber TaxID=1258893 RepID=UPI0012FFD896|nr:hypothetical protein [Arthrobacter ruber]